ncbi:MAG: hypothetical protein WBA54_15815 [Acidaminobacteraceae bacterium]
MHDAIGKSNHLPLYIIVSDIAFVFEYIADKHKITIQKEGFHQLDLVFECKLRGDINMEIASEIDNTQTGYEWVLLDDLMDIIMYPLALREKVKLYLAHEKRQVYLGEVE